MFDFDNIEKSLKTGDGGRLYMELEDIQTWFRASRPGWRIIPGDVDMTASEGKILVSVGAVVIDENGKRVMWNVASGVYNARDDEKKSETRYFDQFVVPSVFALAEEELLHRLGYTPENALRLAEKRRALKNEDRPEEDVKKNMNEKPHSDAPSPSPESEKSGAPAEQKPKKTPSPADIMQALNIMFELVKKHGFLKKFRNLEEWLVETEGSNAETRNFTRAQARLSELVKSIGKKE